MAGVGGGRGRAVWWVGSGAVCRCALCRTRVCPISDLAANRGIIVMQNRSVVSLMRQLPLLYRCTALPLLSGPTSCDRCSSLPTLRICPTAPPRRASLSRAGRATNPLPRTTPSPLRTTHNSYPQHKPAHATLLPAFTPVSLALLVPFQPAILPPAHSLSLCSSPRSLTRPPLAESNHPFRTCLGQSATRSLHAIDHHNPPPVP